MFHYREHAFGIPDEERSDGAAHLGPRRMQPIKSGKGI